MGCLPGASHPGKSASHGRKFQSNFSFLPEPPGSWTPATENSLSWSIHSPGKEGIANSGEPTSWFTPSALGERVPTGGEMTGSGSVFSSPVLPKETPQTETRAPGHQGLQICPVDQQLDLHQSACLCYLIYNGTAEPLSHGLL